MHWLVKIQLANQQRAHKLGLSNLCKTVPYRTIIIIITALIALTYLCIGAMNIENFGKTLTAKMATSRIRRYPFVHYYNALTRCCCPIGQQQFRCCAANYTAKPQPAKLPCCLPVWPLWLCCSSARQAHHTTHKDPISAALRSADAW